MNENLFSTIIFDLSEVLISGLLNIEEPLAYRLGTTTDGLFATLGGQPLIDLFCGRITEDAYFSQLIEHQQWKITVKDLQSIFRNNFHQRVPGMDSMIKALAEIYELVLVSDHAKEWISYIQEIHPFLHIFTNQFYSFQIGQTKSEPSTFPRVMESIRRRPEQCLFIDDRLDNLAAAEKAGIRGIRFTNAEDLKRQLRKMGILTRQI